MADLESVTSLPDNPNRVISVGQDLLAVIMPDKQLWKVDLCSLRELPEFDQYNDQLIADLFKIAGPEALKSYGIPQSNPGLRAI